LLGRQSGQSKTDTPAAPSKEAFAKKFPRGPKKSVLGNGRRNPTWESEFQIEMNGVTLAKFAQ